MLTVKFSGNSAGSSRSNLNRISEKTCSIAAVLFLLQVLPVEANSVRKVDFYGVVCSDADSNMVSMTENLYFTQLGELESVSVTDKRNDTFSKSYLTSGQPDFSSSSADSLAFYALITKNKDGSDRWISTLVITNCSDGKIYTNRKEYDSYYKILMESKAALQAVFKQLVASSSDTPKTSSFSAQISTEDIAGTWSGENFIDKIVILRGGRGFIIFKNGASMNIKVEISQNENGSSVITITQAGHSNASYFPELDRKTALESAPDAAPIEWIMTLSDANTMNGTKKTLVTAPDTATGAASGTVTVEWNRKIQ